MGKWMQNLSSASEGLAERPDPAFCSEEVADGIRGAMTPRSCDAVLLP